MTSGVAVAAEHRAIARGMAWVALFLVIGKVVGAAKEMAVAYRYGVGAEVDAYLYLLNLVSWPGAVAFSVLSVLVVPLAARLRVGAEIARFRAELLGFTLLVGTAIAALAWFGVAWLIDAGWSGLPATSAAIATGMLPALVPLAPLGILISLFAAWTLAAGRHSNTLVEAVPALVIAAAVLAFGDGAIIAPLVWGTLAGFACHLAALAWPLGARGALERPRFTRRSPEWQAFFRGFGIMLGGQILFSSTTLVDQFFAAQLGTGAVAALGYANRILALILSLGATTVSRATLPVFAQAQVSGASHIGRVARQWIALMFLTGLVAAAIGWWFAPWVVRVLFERGAFDAEATALVTEIFRFGLAQVPFFFAGLVLVSFASSQRRYRLLLWSGVMGFVLKIVANALLIERFGIAGITLAWAPVYAASALMFLLALRRRA